MSQQHFFLSDSYLFSFLISTLFCIGIYGVLFSRSNLLILFISLELMLVSVCLNFIYFFILKFQAGGLTIAILLLSTAATEMSIGLSLLVYSYRLKQSITFESLNSLKD